jgi:hypothetical protein
MDLSAVRERPLQVKAVTIPRQPTQVTLPLKAPVNDDAFR